MQQRKTMRRLIHFEFSESFKTFINFKMVKRLKWYVRRDKYR